MVKERVEGADEDDLRVGAQRVGPDEGDWDEVGGGGRGVEDGGGGRGGGSEGVVVAVRGTGKWLGGLPPVAELAVAPVCGLPAEHFDAEGGWKVAMVVLGGIASRWGGGGGWWG